MNARRIGDGVYKVAHDGRTEIVYVAGPPDDRWAFWNGATFRTTNDHDPLPRTARADVVQSLTAPMPATVLKVLVQPGASVRKGDAVLILEAMKMELPLRAPADAVVGAINCREGDLVQPDVTLVELN
jgi:biotin carboxyl carrier protein